MPNILHRSYTAESSMLALWQNVYKSKGCLWLVAQFLMRRRHFVGVDSNISAKSQGVGVNMRNGIGPKSICLRLDILRWVHFWSFFFVRMWARCGKKDWTALFLKNKIHVHGRTKPLRKHSTSFILKPFLRFIYFCFLRRNLMCPCFPIILCCTSPKVYFMTSITGLRGKKNK